jgi:hypothetical protein
MCPDRSEPPTEPVPIQYVRVDLTAPGTMTATMPDNSESAHAWVAQYRAWLAESFPGARLIVHYPEEE